MLVTNPQTYVPDRPILRGYSHLVGAIVAPFGLLVLLLVADSPRGIVGGAIFGSSLIIRYSTSAIYHLVPLGSRLRVLVRRLDHSIIFVFIAATYTPFTLMLMSNGWGIPLLSVVAGLAGAGVVVSLAGPVASRWIRVMLYVTLGWIGIVAISELLSALPGRAIVLLLLGGILYSLGGAIYAAADPIPFPRVFGYHEIFHALEIAATVVVYSVVLIFVLPS